MKVDANTTACPEVTVDPKAAAELNGNATTAVATRLEPQGELVLGAIEGSLEATGIQWPRLQIAYGTGNLAKAGFPTGSWVLNKQHRLAGLNEPLQVVFLHVFSYWKEYIGSANYQPGVLPKVYPDEKTARASGELTQWPPKGQQGPRPTAAPAWDVRLLIRKPKELECMAFGYEGKDGYLYAPAKWSVDKSAYRAVQPVVTSELSWSLSKRGMLSGVFEISTMYLVNKNTQQERVVPKIRLVAANTPEFVEALQKTMHASVMKSSTVDAADEEGND